MKYFEGEWDKPNLTHWYLMQLNSTVRNLFAKKPILVKDSKLKFSSGKKPVTEEQKEQHQSWIKSLWTGRVGFKGDNK